MSIKIFDQKGFSLTEVMVGVGLLGGVSIVTMKIMQDQAGNERMLRASTEVNKTISILQGAVSKPASCANMFKGIVPTAAGTNINSLRSDTAGTKWIEYLNDSKNYGAFFLQPGDIKLVLVQAGAAGATSKGELVLNFRVRKNGVQANFTSETGSQNDNLVTKRLPIEFTADPVSGAVAGCGPVLSDANEMARIKFCQSMDPNEDITLNEHEIAGKGVSYWNPTTKKCNLNSMDCPHGQVPQDMTSLGGVNCVPLEDTMDAAALQQMFTPGTCQSNGGNYTLQMVGGKLTIDCTP